MKRLVVYLNGERVGFLTDGDEPVFAYDSGWLAGGPDGLLSRQLPQRVEPFSGRVVRAFFSGLLPEADPRDRIASILGISAGNDFAMLERIGGECAGAVSVLPEEMPPPVTEAGRLRWLGEDELVAIVEKLPHQPLMAGEEGLRLSLAGAQIKLPVVLAPDGTRVALPLDGSPSTHILKPEPARFPGLAANEDWCMALARKIGLRAAESHWRIIGKTPCLIVKRYDRFLSTGMQALRLHQEDFCQALGLSPERKYQQEGGPSLKDCFSLLRDWSSVPVIDIRDFLDAVIFAALSGNADAHGKNFSFLYANGQRRLAPLYDQVCTLVWPQLSKSLSMKIGTAGTLADVSPEHFRQLAAEARLGWPMVRERLAGLCGRITDSIRREKSPVTDEAGKPAETPAGIVRVRAERMLRLLQGHPS